MPDEKPEKRAARSERSRYSPDPHRLLPQSPDAEKGILSSCLIAPREIIGLCMDKGVTRDWFAIPSHAEIFSSLCEMDSLVSINGELDFIALTQFLRDKNRLDSCGGAAFITELFTFLPTAANAPYYLDVLDEKRQLRELIKVGTEFASRGYDEQDNVDGLVDQAEAEIMKVRQSRFGKAQSKTAKQLVVEAIAYIEELYERKGRPMGLPTGFPDLDTRVNGLTANRLIVLAARPSVGKTALAMNIAETLAISHMHGGPKIGVLVFSLEMSAQQLMNRFLCAMARVNPQRVQDGFLSERDFPNLQMAASKISGLSSNLIIDDFSEATIQYIRAKARRQRSEFRKQGIMEMVVITDYLQLVSSRVKTSSGSYSFGGNRENEVSEVSRGHKLMCKELDICSIAIAQMNRAIEKETRKRAPRLSDLRESGSLEQDADDVWFLSRDDMVEDDEERDANRGRAWVNVAKQRNGEAGPGVKVPLIFLSEYTRFETRAKGEDQPELI